MLFNWKRIKKILPWILILVVALAVFSFWEDARTYIQDRLSFLPWIEKSLDSNKKNDDKHDELRKLVISTEDTEIEIYVEEARTHSELQDGLMYREELCEECGMLFYFDEDRYGGFWMKNCVISLDMIFINSDGEVVYIEHSAPPCKEESCPSYQSDSMYRYTLEVNGGWSDKYEVNVGDKISGM